MRDALDVTLDGFLGGKLTLAQPKRGHRVGSDAALLAAANGASAERIVDVGAGVGAVGLSIALRWPEARISLVEIEPDLAALARDNAARNRLDDRTMTFACDVTDGKARRAAGLVDASADLVVSNPPYYEEPRAQASPDLGRARAHLLPRGTSKEAALMKWLRACIALLKPRGRLILIHRPDALTEILAAFDGRLGALALLPVYPKAGTAAHRVLISGVLGARAPLKLAPGLVLHDASGAFTREADAIHRGEAMLAWDAR